MIATSSPQRTPGRSALTATAALLCIALAAWSSTSNKPAAAPGTAQTSGASKSSDTSGPANSSAAASSAAGTGTSHPCALLTQAEVESAFGQPFSAARETVIANGGVCGFGSADGHAHLLFTVSSWAVLSHARSAVGVSPSPVSGVGDEAFTVEPGSGAPVLFVRKGSSGFYLAMTGPQVASLADHGLAKVESLAALILQRL